MKNILREIRNRVRAEKREVAQRAAWRHPIDQAGWNEHLLYVEEMEESYRVAREERVAKQIEERETAREERRAKRLEEERENQIYREEYKERYG